VRRQQGADQTRRIEIGDVLECDPALEGDEGLGRVRELK